MALNINGTTGISGVDGSVSAPTLTGTDSNTGITFPLLTPLSLLLVVLKECPLQIAVFLDNYD